MGAQIGSQPARFELGDWLVDPASKRLECGEQHRQLEPRVIDVLVALCAQPGEVLSAEELLARCWPDGEPAGDNPVHKAITLLRKALGDSATEPRYIETIRKRGYRIVAPVRSQAGQARSGAWQGGSPFRGLRPFEAAHASVFFGREQATAELLECARQQLRRQHGLVLVLGPSGSGKTSLVSAGLVPALRREALDGRWRLVSEAQLDLADLSTEPTPGEELTGDQLPGALALALAAAMLDWETVSGEALLAGFNAHDLARALRETPQTVLAELGAALQRQPGVSASEQGLALLFIDRLEALFRPPLGESAQIDAVLRLLQTLAESGLILLVAACRNDYYPQLAEHAWLMRDKAQGGHLDLAPASAAEIAQMVRLPARAAGLSFGVDPSTQQRLDDLLCDAAAASPDALPLLQYTLEQLYQQRSAHGELSFAAYQALGGASGDTGGLEGVIAEQAEQLIRGLTLVQQAALPQVLALLVVVGEDEGSPVGSRRALWSELREAAVRELVQALVDARLLVSEHGSALTPGDETQADEPGFRVAHEALLRRWPRVTDWIAEHRQHLQTRARLRQQVQRWTQGGRAAEFLWPRGRQLQDALTLREQRQLGLSDVEQDFLGQCERRAAWTGRLKAGAVVSLAGLALLAGGMAWRAQSAEQLAQQKRADSERLLGYMLGEVSEQLRPEGKLALLEGVSQQALAVLGSSGDVARLSAEERLQRAKALLLLGEVEYEKRRPDAAARAFEAALALSQQARADTPISPAHFSAWGAAEFWLAELARDAGALDLAEAHQQAYREVCQRWQKAWPDDANARLELGMAEVNLGVLALRRLRPDQASQKFAAANAIRRALLAQHPDDINHLQSLMSSLSWAMEAEVLAGQPTTTLALADEALALSQRWKALAPQDLRLQEAQANVYGWQVEALKMQGKVSTAQTVQREVLKLRQALASHDPANANWQLLQLRAQLNLWLLPGSGQASASELAQAAKQLESWEGRVSASEWQTQALKLALLQARQQTHGGDATDALLTLKQSPPRPKNGVLNLRWTDLQAQADWDAQWLQLLQTSKRNGAGLPSRQAVCGDLNAFWAPLLGTPLQGRFPELLAQLKQCLAARTGP